MPNSSKKKVDFVYKCIRDNNVRITWCWQCLYVMCGCVCVFCSGQIALGAGAGKITVENSSSVAVTLIITKYYDASGNSVAIPDPRNRWSLSPKQSGTLTLNGQPIIAKRVHYTVTNADGATHWVRRSPRNGVLRINVGFWTHRSNRQLWRGILLADRGKTNPHPVRFEYLPDSRRWQKLEDDPVLQVTRIEELKELTYDSRYVDLLDPLTGKYYRLYNEFAAFESYPDSDWILLTYKGGWIRKSDYSAIDYTEAGAYASTDIEWQGVVFDDDGNAIGVVDREPVSGADNSSKSSRDQINEQLDSLWREQDARFERELIAQADREELERKEKQRRDEEHARQEKKKQDEYKATVARINGEFDRRERNRKVADDFVANNRCRYGINGTCSPVGGQTQCNYFARELIEKLTGASIPELNGEANDIYDSLDKAAKASANTGWYSVETWLKASPTYRELEQRFATATSAKEREMFQMKVREMQFLAVATAVDRGRTAVAVVKSSSGDGHIAVITPAPTQFSASIPEMHPPRGWGIRMPYISQAGKVNDRFLDGKDGVWSGKPISEGFTKKDLASMKIYILDKQNFNDLNLEPGMLKKP